MNKRILGKSGLAVAPLAFGGNVFGWTIDERTSFNILDAFVAAGFNLIDTANVYSRWVPGNQGGESETIIGKWMKSRNNRDQVVIATKVGIEMGPGNSGLSKTHILSAVEDSLRRLRTDRIDLYFSHVDDPNTPLEETLETYDQLIREGKIRTIGASNYTAQRLSQALDTSKRLGLPRYECLQPNYNLYNRAKYEQELEPLCLKENLCVTNYYALASGFLTGKYRSERDLSKSQRGEGLIKLLNERGMRILDALDEVAEEYHATPAGIAIAWLMARPSITAPIASATSLSQLDSLIQAVNLDLAPAAIETLNDASTY